MEGKAEELKKLAKWTVTYKRVSFFLIKAGSDF